jgi:hypothetical protein
MIGLLFDSSLSLSFYHEVKTTEMLYKDHQLNKMDSVS